MKHLILHHYWPSPVSEKIRIVFGIKNANWHSVEIPRLLPKPDLMPLTGGYRLTPVLQVGADIFCDTRAINHALENFIPKPSLFPCGVDDLGFGTGKWTDEPLFKLIVTAVFVDTAESMPEGFWADRSQLYFNGNLDISDAKSALPETLAKIQTQFGLMEEQLAGNKSFMQGSEPGLSDALCYYLIWFFRGRFSEGATLINSFSRLSA